MLTLRKHVNPRCKNKILEWKAKRTSERNEQKVQLGKWENEPAEEENGEERALKLGLLALQWAPSAAEEIGEAPGQSLDPSMSDRRGNGCRRAARSSRAAPGVVGCRR